MSPLVLGRRETPALCRLPVSHREPGTCRIPPGCRWGSLPRDLMSSVGAGCPHSCMTCTSVGGGQWGVCLRDLGDRAGPTRHREASVCGPGTVSSRNCTGVWREPRARHDVTLSSRTPGRPVHLVSHPGKVGSRENPRGPSQARGPSPGPWSWTVGWSSGRLWSLGGMAPPLHLQT